MVAVLDFFELVAKDAIGICPAPSDAAAHREAAEAWLRRAHDESGDHGVSYGYSFRGGWQPSYRETSGYIAPTFFDLARERNDPSYRERALRICRWLIEVQNKDGSFANPRYGEDGIVFDTGQDLLGLVRAYQESGDVIFENAAVRAGNWLVHIAGPDGIWTRNEFLNTPHVYNTRTAWALLELNRIRFSAERERIARANLDWAVAQQQPSGLFDSCAFERGRPPYTHTISYTAEGLLGAGELLSDRRYITAAQNCADAALAHLRADGHLPGEIDIKGRAAAKYCCLTGNCQFALVWAKLFALTQREEYRRAALRALRYVMDRQDIRTGNLNVRGAIKGSHPIWARYSPLCFPNWPAKFFVDAMLRCEAWFP